MSTTARKCIYAYTVNASMAIRFLYIIHGYIYKYWTLLLYYETKVTIMTTGNNMEIVLNNCWTVCGCDYRESPSW